MSLSAHKTYQPDPPADPPVPPPDTPMPPTDDLPADPPPSHPRHKISILLGLLLIAALVMVTRPTIHGNDGVQNYAYLHSLLIDRDLDFTNEYDHYISLQADWFDKKQIPRDPVTNLPINLYGVGNSILWAPFVLWAQGLIYAAPYAGYSAPALDGYSWPYEWAVGYGSAFYATLGLWLLYRTLRTFRGEISAVWAILLIWLASPLFFYMYLHPSMSHANSFFLATLLLVQYIPRPVKAWRWFTLGLTGGLLTITRFQDGILLSALIIGELWDFATTATPRHRWIFHAIPRYILFLIAFAIALVPQALAWQVLQGSWQSGPRAYISQGALSFLQPVHVTSALFSSRHGLFYWHPALALALIGLFLPGHRLREKLLALTAFAAQAWVIGSWSIWWAGASFGHRMFISTLPFLAIGALFTVSRRGPIGTLLRFLLILLILWNFSLIMQYGLGIISRQKGVPYSELWHNTTQVLPDHFMQKAGLPVPQNP